MSKLFDSDDEGPTAPKAAVGKKVPAFKPKATFTPTDDGPMFANPVVPTGGAAASSQQLPGAMPAMPVDIVTQYVNKTNAAAAAGAPPAAAAAPAAAAPAAAAAPTSVYDPNAGAGAWGGTVTESHANFLATPNPWGAPAAAPAMPTVAAVAAAAVPPPQMPAMPMPMPPQPPMYGMPQMPGAIPVMPGTGQTPLMMGLHPQQYAAMYAGAAAPQQAYPSHPYPNAMLPPGGVYPNPAAAALTAGQIAQLAAQQAAAAAEVPTPEQQAATLALLQQQAAALQQAAVQFQEPLPPVPEAPPTVSNAVWPADLPPLPPAPEQGKVSDMAPAPASPSMPTNEALKSHLHQTTNDSIAWESFLQLRKQLEDSHQNTVNLHGQISQIQLSHEKEASQFREAAQARIEQQRKEIEQAVENYNTALSKIDNLSNILNKKAEAVLALEQQVHELTVEAAAANQRIAHTEDRARVADAGRQVAEVRQRELELTLEHTTELVVNLRKQMQGSHEEKTKAVHEQYAIFEQYRQNLIQYYSDRETKMAEEFNLNIRQVQALMDVHVKEREEKISKHWKETILALEQEYRDIKKANEDMARRHTAEKEEFKREETLEKEKWVSHLRNEMQLLEQRHKEREDHVLTDIARRERELSEREQRARVQRAQDEQDAKINLMSKEAELKAYYEKMAEDMRKSHDTEREKTMASFRDQIQQLQNMHLNNERELERMHREKEREMAQRYRIAGYEIEDQKNVLDLQSVSTKTQSSLLSKFDSIEAKQRERAEQSRQAIKTTSFSNIATTAGLGAATGSPK